jgi:hypothetical protein
MDAGRNGPLRDDAIVLEIALSRPTQLGRPHNALATTRRFDHASAARMLATRLLLLDGRFP